MHPDLAALVGSRICHDLISPIGAIGNGLELLALTDGNSTAEMELINDSVQNAMARIRLFRVAFGGASTTQSISNTEVQSILGAMSNGSRHIYDWQANGDHARGDVRLALLVLLCTESALPVGGTVTVSQAGQIWTVHAQSTRINVVTDLWDSLTNPKSGIAHTAAQVQFALLPRALAEAGRALAFTTSDTSITVRF